MDQMKICLGKINQILSLIRAISFLDQNYAKKFRSKLLIDNKILDQIVNCVEIENKNILEIGPGTETLQNIF